MRMSCRVVRNTRSCECICADRPGHSLQWDVQARPIPSIETGLYYHVAFEDFGVEGIDPGRTSRDATQHRVGMEGMYSFHRNLRSVTLNYEYAGNNAEGDNFVFSSHRFLGRLTTPLVPPLWLILEASYTTQDYTKYTLEPRRTQDNQHYRAVVLLPLGQGLMADVSYSYARYSGGQARFDARRDRVGVGLGYRL